MNPSASRALVGIVCAAGVLANLNAEAVTFPELAAIARRASADCRLIANDEARERAQQALAALARLDSYLQESGVAERSRWQQRLTWTELVSQLKQPEPDLQQLLTISKHFYAPQSGLEADAFREARAALENYIFFQLLLQNRTSEQIREDCRQHLAGVAELLEAPQIDYEALGDHVVWLRTLGQAPTLIDRLRETFHHPNLVVTVSQRMLPTLASQFNQEIARSRWSTNLILGRVVEGMTHFEGQVAGGLRAGGPHSTIQLTLDGTLRAPHNTAYAGPFRLYSRNESAVQGTVQLAWNGERFVAAPARVWATPRTTLTGADVRRRRLAKRSRLSLRLDRFLTNRALQKAAQSQDQAAREAATITARTIAQQFDDTVQQRLVAVNREVAYYYTHPLVRVGMLPDSEGLWTDSALAMRFYFRGPVALTAHVPPPQPSGGDINVFIHESAFRNFIQPYAGGREWTDEFFARIQKEALGDYSVEMRIREEDERWSLLLDWMRPWSTRITESGVRFAVRASGFSVDGHQYAIPLEIQATFQSIRPAAWDFGWERVGDVAIESACDLDPELQRFLQRKLSGFFLDRFFLDGLNAPAGGAWDQLSTVALVDLNLTEGWLHMQFEQTAAAETQTARRGKP